MFEEIVGNEAVKQYLCRVVTANSLLFAGPEGVGKSLFALELAKNLLGSLSHPDLHIFRPEGKTGMHSIGEMRRLSEEVYMAPFQGSWKVFIIHDAERMLPYSSNALLKTFEEPALDSLIILLTSAPAALLPTIVSRCRPLYFRALEVDEMVPLLQKKWNLDEEKARRIAFLSQGSMGQAVRLMEEGGETLREILLKMLTRGKMSSWKELSDKAQEITEKIEESKSSIEESVRKEFYQAPTENLTAAQKESLQKEIEGYLALHQLHGSQGLFDVILGWYRDMSLMQVGGNRSLLIHKDYESEIEQSLQRGETQSLDTVQSALSQAKLSIERSTSLSICLENLFLQLKLL